MKLPCLLLLPVLALCSPPSKETLQDIGMKVWQNECRGTVDGLLTWNALEDFPSLGLGHFIWYPDKVEKKFEESFPDLILFLQKKLKDTDQKIPSWIKPQKGFPWKTREAFLKDKRSKKMVELREFLATTLDLQIAYLYERFEFAERKISPHLSPKQKEQLAALKEDPKGIYALIDYVNFKGMGLSLNERYRGEGWGLLQVLQNLPEDANDLPASFATSAKQVLARRVRNSPKERNEERFLNGWYKRLETYNKF